MDKPPELSLSVQNPARATNLPTRAQIRKILSSVLTRAAEITVRFAGIEEGRELNETYRGRDYATNILSFTYHCDDAMVAGDLVLCPDVVAQEARAQSKSLPDHYAHLLVHGALHLQGWDHEKPAEAKRMETYERKLLAQLGIADPYQSKHGQ